ncbi:MAG: ISNCY family transposase [Spirochaetales bacterium]|nr:ISNCY family transposase [Spirochaetales bacterium]
MRKRFEQQFALGQILIKDIQFTTRTRDRLSCLYRALQEIFINTEYNEQIFSILEKEISNKKKKTGRAGMDLWILFTLAQTRLCLDIDYDELLYRANYDTLLRQLMGIEIPFEKGREFKYQTIVDNVSLISDEALKEINDIILTLGSNVFKKKRDIGGVCLKTDSFVVRSNVHFPTDYNLLWDSGRKCLDIIKYFLSNYPELKGWRKYKQWRRLLKNGSRSVGMASKGGGKNKEVRVKRAVKEYLDGARRMSVKLHESKESLPQITLKDIAMSIMLDNFLQLMDKHIDLLERRILKGEKIPHEEKIFSIFESYTEWITKGKLYPSVELGKKVLITTNQDNLIVDYLVMDHLSDSESVIVLCDRLTKKIKTIKSWSFDKGFYSKKNKEYLANVVENLIMPKRGKRNTTETEEETAKPFKVWRNKHSAVESNINELEHCGLDRCPDRGYENYQRYIALGVTAYNLRRIGKQLLIQDAAIKLKQSA